MYLFIKTAVNFAILMLIVTGYKKNMKQRIVQCSIQYLNINNQCKILNYILTRYNWLEWGVGPHPVSAPLAVMYARKCKICAYYFCNNSPGGSRRRWVWGVMSPHQDPPTPDTEPTLTITIIPSQGKYHHHKSRLSLLSWPSFFRWSIKIQTKNTTIDGNTLTADQTRYRLRKWIPKNLCSIIWVDCFNNVCIEKETKMAA